MSRLFTFIDRPTVVTVQKVYPVSLKSLKTGTLNERVPKDWSCTLPQF